MINIAVGVVTGLVQEFQFGMNWSAYSRFVGDVFGAPLAMEGLAAFFLESTFLGLWLFGWDRLSRRVHLATIWMVALGAAALGGVHHGRELVDAAPGRLHDRPDTGRPQLTNIGAVFTNPVFLWGYVHVLLASLVTGAVRDARASRPGTCAAEPAPELFAPLGAARRSSCCCPAIAPRA